MAIGTDARGPTINDWPLKSHKFRILFDPTHSLLWAGWCCEIVRTKIKDEWLCSFDAVDGVARLGAPHRFQIIHTLLLTDT